jgi:nucleotide-binding universal stress UspA family protein
LIGLRTELRQEGFEVRTHVIEGLGVASLICDYIKDEGIDLVVMSTHGRGGLTRFLFGSVTNQVIQGVKVPVMLVHPDSQ